MSFNRNLTVNIGSVVFFIKPEFIFDGSDYNGMKIKTDSISQGIVTQISGASDMDICIKVRDVEGNIFTACQELFSENLQQILDIVNFSEGYIGSNDWVCGLKKKCGNKIKYSYKIEFPYKKGEYFDTIQTEWGYKKNVTLERCIFSASHNNNNTSYQLSSIENTIYSAQNYEIDSTIPPFIINRIDEP